MPLNQFVKRATVLLVVISVVSFLLFHLVDESVAFHRLPMGTGLVFENCSDGADGPFGEITISLGVDRELEIPGALLVGEGPPTPSLPNWNFSLHEVPAPDPRTVEALTLEPGFNDNAPVFFSGTEGSCKLLLDITGYDIGDEFIIEAPCKTKDINTPIDFKFRLLSEFGLAGPDPEPELGNVITNSGSVLHIDKLERINGFSLAAEGRVLAGGFSTPFSGSYESEGQNPISMVFDQPGNNSGVGAYRARHEWNMPAPPNGEDLANVNNAEFIFFVGQVDRDDQLEACFTEGSCDTAFENAPNDVARIVDDFEFNKGIPPGVISCDGNGGFKANVFENNLRIFSGLFSGILPTPSELESAVAQLKDCVQIHEDLHVEHYSAAPSPISDACDGCCCVLIPSLKLISPAGLCFAVRSQIAAYEASIECVNDKLSSDIFIHPDELIMYEFNRIQQIALTDAEERRDDMLDRTDASTICAIGLTSGGG